MKNYLALAQCSLLYDHFAFVAFIDKIIADVEQVVTGRYKAVAFYFGMSDRMKTCEEDPMFIQKMRDDYFADEQTADSAPNDEKCAQMIFPDGHFAFELIRETRAGDRSWQRIDQEDLLMQITKVIPKKECHRYDEEWRMITWGNVKPPIMLEWIPNGIVLGLRMGKSERGLVISLAKQAGIKHIFESFINRNNQLDAREI